MFDSRRTLPCEVSCSPPELQDEIEAHHDIVNEYYESVLKQESMVYRGVYVASPKGETGTAVALRKKAVRSQTSLLLDLLISLNYTIIILHHLVDLDHFPRD